ncbi:MAG: tRNA pseudouridine(13) synthase TruD [Myxococcales bacterium]|nr:tRNA pseudouridine(13) synthase TruD [Myxococcales bacterium]MBL0198014.1 tRNA pseudouridine(13) synthase TruD [Myxococcales bacterium]
MNVRQVTTTKRTWVASTVPVGYVGGVAKPRARIKTVPEDFVVDEEPAYVASGVGDHVFARVEKRNLTTHDAVSALAEVAGVHPRDVGVAGLKDKVAITTQWLSFLALPGTQVEERLRAYAAAARPDLRVLDLQRHGNKLRTGHLVENRFRIRLRDLDPARVAEVEAALLGLEASGVPNAFGQQRFGRDADNVARALAFLSGQERGPREPRARKFLFSALQSEVFNRVLAAREADGTWTTPLLGDVLKLETGGLFVCTEPEVDQARAARGELCPTGPMVGVKMRATEHEVLALETRVAAEVLGPSFDLGRTRALGEGTRRPLVLRVSQLKVTREEAASGAPDAPHARVNLVVEFALPKGAYATTVLARVVDAEEPTRESRESREGRPRRSDDILVDA